MALDADKNEPFMLNLAQALLIDSETPVTYLHPARLIRTNFVPYDAGAISERLRPDRSGGDV